MDKRSELVRRWEDVIREQEASGLSAGEYCRWKKICAHTFYVWRKRLKINAEPVGGFVRLIPPQVTSAPMEIVTPNGYRVGMRHADESELRQILLLLRTL